MLWATHAREGAGVAGVAEHISTLTTHSVQGQESFVVPKGYAEVVTPMGRSLDELVQAGRLSSVFCRLARTRFTGVVYAEHADEGGVFSFRDGMPVFAEDLGDAPLMADQMLERGLINSVQYAEIATRVIDQGCENEDLGFCEVAVELGVLTQAQVDAELERKLRGRMMQAVGWDACRIEIDGDPDSVAAVAQYPQDLGPLVHTGVRTFFDEERIRELLGPIDTLFVRLTASEQEIVQFFDLGDDEESLISHLRPDVAVAEAIDSASADWLEAWQLVCMLVLGEHVEVGRAPFAPAGERSGVRSSHAVSAPTGRYVATTGVREERVPQRSLPQTPAAKHAVAAVETAVAPTATEAPRRPAAPGSRAAAARAAMNASPQGERMIRGVGERTPARAASNVAVARAGELPAATSQTAGASSPGAAGARRDPRRRLTNALQRLDRNLKDLRQQTAAVAPAAAPRAATNKVGSTLTGTSGGAAPATGDAAKRAHVEQLLRMRQAKHSGEPPPKPDKVDGEKTGADAFRSAQELMRDNQWPRALEVMKKLCEAEPNHEQYGMYRQYAALRAGSLDEEGITKLRGTLREKISDDVLGKFAYYALGHLALVEKKDEAAEKFFRKAIELDKTNKDAERHIRIIELRRKSAAKDQGNNKIFGIEIGKKKS